MNLIAPIFPLQGKGNSVQCSDKTLVASSIYLSLIPWIQFNNNGVKTQIRLPIAFMHASSLAFPSLAFPCVSAFLLSLAGLVQLLIFFTCNSLFPEYSSTNRALDKLHFFQVFAQIWSS